MLATLDVLSGGRVIFGVGAGGAPDEFQALGVPSHQRGRRTDEYLLLMVALWTEDPTSFRGRFFSFTDVRFQPKPLQKPHPPIWVGGRSEPPCGVRWPSGRHGTPRRCPSPCCKRRCSTLSTCPRRPGVATVLWSRSTRASASTMGPLLVKSAAWAKVPQSRSARTCTGTRSWGSPSSSATSPPTMPTTYGEPLTPSRRRCQWPTYRSLNEKSSAALACSRLLCRGLRDLGQQPQCALQRGRPVSPGWSGRREDLGHTQREPFLQLLLHLLFVAINAGGIYHGVAPLTVGRLGIAGRGPHARVEWQLRVNHALPDGGSDLAGVVVDAHRHSVQQRRHGPARVLCSRFH